MSDLLDRLRTGLADRYEIDREIGAGGMATVFLADDLKHHRQVAIKVLNPELAAVVGADRFLREIETTARLRHPNILPLYDSGEADGLLFYVMPFVEGGSLADRIKREKQLPVEDAVQVASEVAEALDAAHEEGVIHRDVKPENILLERGHAVVADFGIAKAIADAGNDGLTRTGTSIGTPEYMSPEQASGESDLDRRSDLYSLGCVLYEMMAGEPPFTGPAESVVRQHLVTEPHPVSQIRSGVPEGVTRVLERMLAKTPADRFGTMADLVGALSKADQARPSRKKGGPRAATAALIVAGAVAAIAAGLILLRPVGGTATTRAWMLPADFSGTAEPEYLDMARELVRVELDQSPTITLLTSAEVSQGLRMADRADTTTVGQDLALELAERGGIGAVLVGEVDRAGSTYSVRLRVLDPAARGEQVAGATGLAEGEDQLIRAIGDAARKLRSQLGETSAELAGNPPLYDLMTPSLPAYRKYREAYGRPVNSRDRIILLREALQLDTGFAQAMLSIPNYFANIGDYDSTIVYVNRALKRTDRLTEQQVLNARAAAASVRGDIPEAYRLQREMADRYGVGQNTVGVFLERLGRLEEAADYFRNLKRPFGNFGFERTNQMLRLIDLGQLDEAEALMGPDLGPEGPRVEFWLLVARGQLDDALSYASSRANDVTLPPSQRAHALHWQADVLAVRGAVAASWRALEKAIVLEPGMGDERAVEGSRLLLALASERPVPPLAGTLGTDSSTASLLFRSIAAATRGDSVTALELVRGVKRRPPETYAAYTTAFLMSEAGIAMSAEDWSRVPELIGPAATGFWPHYPRGNLRNPQLIQWMVGEAYQRLNEPDSAIAYFEMLTERPQDVPRRSFAKSFAHRRLARLYTDLGQKKLAREHWQHFLDTFTTPDREFEWMVEEGKQALEES